MSRCGRGWLLVVLFWLRKGSLVEAVPVALRGIGGPGAPHWFEFHRRETLGFLRKH